mgnify:CR=1 FL=1
MSQTKQQSFLYELQALLDKYDAELTSDGGHDFYSEINLWIKDEKAVNLGSHINSETPKTI